MGATASAAAAGLLARLVPPREPQGTLARPALEERLTAGLDRRLTFLVAGAGYGKSTLVARSIAGRRAAWYTVDASDRRVGAFGAGVVAALRRAIPDLPEDLATPVATAVDPADDAEAIQRGQAAATLVADALQDWVQDDLVLVLDDCHELGEAVGAWRFVEALVRFAPDPLHIVLASRSAPPFGIERLRAQGAVEDLAGLSLAFETGEIAELVRRLLPDDVVPRGQVDDAARRIASATAGWPAAVRLTLEALRAAPAGGREAVLDRLQRPDGPLFPYLAQEVVAAASDETRNLLAHAALLERFSGPLLHAAGVPGGAEVLGALGGDGLFLVPLAGDPGWFTLHGLIREYARTRLPVPPAAAAAVHLRAALWLEVHGRSADALTELVAAGDLPALGAFLDRHAARLVAAGATRDVTEAAAMLPAELRSPALERACGEAFMVRGDWRAATASLLRSSDADGQLDAGAAWRLGLVHGLRGDYDRALEIYDRARLDGQELAEEALLWAWRASAHYHKADVAAAADAANYSLELASAAGSARALAAAWTAEGMSAELVHDPRRAGEAFERAVTAAVEAGDVLQEVRIRNAQGALELELGDLAAAYRTCDEAIHLAEAVGFASFHARALVNRGRAAQGLGRFEEALADLSAARRIYERVGSPSVAYPLVREGSLHQLRGDVLLARFAFDAAVRAARGSADTEALAPALVGLAQVIAADDPDRACELADEAVELGRQLVPLTVLLGAARTYLRLGEPDTARRLAREATNLAAARQDQPGYAAGLEIQAQTLTDQAQAELLCERAAGVWRDQGIPYGYARNRLITAEIADGDRARRAASDAAGIFRSIGARGPAAEADARLEALDLAARPPVAIESLGRFRILRDGEPVPATAWQSRKARDLLKVLVARVGRPTTRESLFEILWPDEDPEPLANRLSVALATARAVLDPARRHAPDWFIGGDKQALWLDLAHVELDIERFLAAAEEGLRLAREGDAAEAARRLGKAETRYTGDFLEEDPYEDWAVAIREEAQAAYIATTRHLAEAASSAGDADTATRYYLRILERDGYDEAAHMGLVAALLAAGRHGEARRRYGLYADRMTELGVEAAPFPSARRGPGTGG